MTAHARAGSTGRLKVALAATAGVAVLEARRRRARPARSRCSPTPRTSTMDVVALAIALAAAVQAKRPATQRQTYGFARYEILAALANGALLIARHGPDRRSRRSGG